MNWPVWKPKISKMHDDYLKLRQVIPRFKDFPRWRKFGRVVYLVGNIVEVAGLRAALGDVCKILPAGGFKPIYAEVIGFNQKRLKLSPLTPLSGIAPGDTVQPHHQASAISLHPSILGRVIDGMGEPIDGKGPLLQGISYPLSGDISNCMERPVIKEQLDVGIRSINSLLPIGKGQRMGIFAGSGVGKSTLLGMIARYTSADVNVIALIGERGREVNEFLESELGADGLEHSVVVVATSDQPATVRMRGAYVACAIAEFFRDQGRDVLLMMDSVTRFAMAAREVYLAAGEPPTTKGYTPSVFSHLPRLLERAGNFERASITGIYSVLVEGGDMEDPIADSVRSILDGHIVLDRSLTQKRHYPAINLLKSVSRLASRLHNEKDKFLAAKLTRTLSRYNESEDMIHIGAYIRGSHAETDYAIDMIDRINDFLRQPVDEKCTIEEARASLAALFE
ncbi:FliI/YscN family ATPase [Desulforhabdus amnigena]|nr:FliI/YscN family ATPase [Desulforhabdus amnigena]